MASAGVLFAGKRRGHYLRQVGLWRRAGSRTPIPVNSGFALGLLYSDLVDDNGAHQPEVQPRGDIWRIGRSHHPFYRRLLLSLLPGIRTYPASQPDPGGRAALSDALRDSAG